MSELQGLKFMRAIKEEYVRISTGMKAGNEIRRQMGLEDAIARLALIPIHETRVTISGDETVPAERHCFIVSSLKRERNL
jgi:hypothetical protein